jgi:hypothetical protein
MRDSFGLSAAFYRALFLLPWSAFLISGATMAKEKIKRMIPDEYESVGSSSMGLGNSGAAATGSVSSVRVNPALLPFEPQYTATASYHWPVEGREFYQVGVVDSVTSKIAAAVNYTGFLDKSASYKEHYPTDVDAPLKSRVGLALAGGFEKVALGVTAQYVDGLVEDSNKVMISQKGATAGLGVAGLFTPTIKFGLSVENLGNRQVKTLAPRFVRAGIGMLWGANFSWFLDLQERERVDVFENRPVREAQALAALPISSKIYSDPERMIINSMSVKFMNVLKLLASYGHSVSSDQRQSLYASIGVVQQRFMMSYSIGNPYLGQQDALRSSLDLSIVFQ